MRDLTTDEQAHLARWVIRRQGGLSLRVAAVFLVLILGLPLLNAAAPEAMNEAVLGGFTPTWLLLGVFFYPITVALSAYFVAASDRIEAESLDWRQALPGGSGADRSPAPHLEAGAGR